MIARWLARLQPTDYRLVAPINGWDGVAYDPATGDAVMGQVLPNGPRGLPFVAPVGTWTRTETEDRVEYPAAPADWRRLVAGKGWRGW